MSDTSCGKVRGIPVEHRFLEILEYISLAICLNVCLRVCINASQWAFKKITRRQSSYLGRTKQNCAFGRKTIPTVEGLGEGIILGCQAAKKNTFNK